MECKYGINVSVSNGWYDHSYHSLHLCQKKNALLQQSTLMRSYHKLSFSSDMRRIKVYIHFKRKKKFVVYVFHQSVSCAFITFMWNGFYHSSVK